MIELSSRYEPAGIEEKWQDRWEKEKLFTADPGSKKPPYTIVIPPPNVTGKLTLGHVLNNTIQDILIRLKKQQGFEVLWLPGMDHAGIATQVVVEERLREQGLKKEDLGREKFVAEVWKWKEDYAAIIRKQLRMLGCGLDWTRERFTLAGEYSACVVKVFVDLFKKGLIYRGEKIINWCPRCLTALSNEQVETEEKMDRLYYIRYPLPDGTEHVTIATTRPETMLGDTAVCVNPGDGRYTRLVGKSLILPIMNREIKIIADSYVDPEFGTGCLKVTPAHDQFDFELAKKHGLEMINILNPDATLNENAGDLKGMERFAARKKIVDLLGAKGLLEKVEKYKVPLATCERCRTVVEPRISKQWFVRMKPLAGPALEIVKNEGVRIFPRRWINLYNHWLENVIDWVISRQLWWGHRIPVYYCRSCYREEDDAGFTNKGIVVSEQKPARCPACGSTDMVQDEDVLDTWFSSWLWPFATLGWPQPTADFRRFYPTQTLVTAWDIIYLWVARMIMAGLEFTGQKPFAAVVFHTMVRDEKGRKMSKSLGNSPDPVDLIQKYGADGLRLGLMLITPAGQDVLFSEKSIEVGRKFLNKLWNASRFVAQNAAGRDGASGGPTVFDYWICREFDRLLAQIERHYENFEINAIVKKLYDFVWHTFCDWYIEFIKLEPYDRNNLSRELLKKIVIVLHAFVPFITEEIHERFEEKKSLLLETWPKPFGLPSSGEAVEDLIALVTEIRNIRGLFKISPKEPLDIYLKISAGNNDFFDGVAGVIRKLAGVGAIAFGAEPDVPAAAAIGRAFECYVALKGIEIDREKTRLEKEIGFLREKIEAIKFRLDDPRHADKLTSDFRQREQERLDDLTKKKEGMQNAIKRL